MQFLKIREVMAITALAHSSVYLKVKDGTFPAPVKLGKRASAWDSGEIEDWMTAKLAARDARAETGAAA